MMRTLVTLVLFACACAAHALEAECVVPSKPGDRWECLFKAGDTSVRAYSRQRVDPGAYWLEMPPEKLWVF